MRICLSAAFAMASAALAAAPMAHAQSAPQAEEDLLGGPDAPITLRPPAPPRIQPAPRKTPPPSVALKPSPAPAKPVVARKTPNPSTVVAEKPRRTKPAIAPRLAEAKPAAPSRVIKPAAKIAEAQPTSVPREPPIIRYQQKQTTPLAPPLEEPTILAEREEEPAVDPPAAAPADEDTPSRQEIEPVPDRQFAQLDRLIERAVRRGDIRARTANALHDDLVGIADMQDELLNEGALGAADRDRIDARLEELRARIDDAAQTPPGPDWR